VLTSGGVAMAEDGLQALAADVQAARGRIAIMAGAGVNAANAGRFVAAGVAEIHASCAAPVPVPGRVSAFGFAAATRRVTDESAVRDLVAAVRPA
jgi:copper homeostasis protein